MHSLTESRSCLLIAAMEKTTESVRYARSMDRGLKALVMKTRCDKTVEGAELLRDCQEAG